MKDHDIEQLILKLETLYQNIALLAEQENYDEAINAQQELQREIDKLSSVSKTDLAPYYQRLVALREGIKASFDQFAVAELAVRQKLLSSRKKKAGIQAYRSSILMK